MSGLIFCHIFFIKYKQKEDNYPFFKKKKKFYNIFNEFYNPSNKKFNSFVIILISEKFFLLNRQIEYLEMTTVRYKCFDSFS